MAKRIGLTVNDEVLKILDSVPERARGRWVSQQLISIDINNAALAEIARRLTRIEQMLERITLRE